MRRQGRLLTVAVVALSAFLVFACDDGSSPVLPDPRPPRAILVAPDGTGDYPTIQAAIDASQDGDTVLLANGRFRGSGNRDLILTGRNLTIRSDAGDPVYCMIDCDGSAAEPHRGMTLGGDEGTTISMDGITIEDGHAVGGGGAVYCEAGAALLLSNMIFQTHSVSALSVDGSSPVIVGCIFRNNAQGAISSHGGSLLVSSSTFRDNYEDYSGAAIWSSASDVTLVDCIFERNVAVFAGGAVYATSAGPTVSIITANNCMFDGNTAGYHGGGAYFGGITLSLQGSTFVNNDASTNGGAIWCTSGSAGSIMSCLFYGNIGVNGAAINSTDSEISLANVIAAFNQGGTVAVCDTVAGPASLHLACSNLFGNSFGDWVGCVETQLGTNGNIAADPLFCDSPNGNFALQPTSPCAPPSSSCGVMGAWSVGCDGSHAVSK